MPQGLRYYMVSFLVPNTQVGAGILSLLKSCPESLHVLGTTFVIGTTEKATDIVNRMVPFLGGTDRVFVVQVAKRPRFAGWLSKGEWGWLNDHLRPEPKLPFPPPRPPEEIEHQPEDADEEPA